MLTECKLMTEVLYFLPHSAAHPLEASTRSNGTADVESTCPHLELLRGRDGMAGRDGREGREGAKGEKGEVGSQGEKGDRGEGPSGPQGVRGALGPHGPAGPAGPQGAVGEKGDRGMPGLQGPQGRQGATGPKGTQGSVGPKGTQGSTGQKGTRGYTGQKGSLGQKGEKGTPGGAIYTRWGKSSCPSVEGTELVYSGKTGGTRHGHRGGAANYLCMPNDPQYGSYTSGTGNGNYVYGAEYSTLTRQQMSGVNNHDAPCAICFASTRGSLLMIPAKRSCPAGWTEEYDGYMMSGRYSIEGRTMYICVDGSPDSVSGEDGDDPDRVELFMVEAKCEGLSCPPYSAEKELTCVVCTR